TAWPMDAVVSLGFCTASFVSPDGLVVTNHHCGYGALQYNSTPQKNLIADGFLARTKGEELPADPTQRVYVTEAISDVTARVNAALKPEMDGYARFMAIDAAKKRLVQGCEQPGYRCEVYTFNGGDSYRLIKQREIRDVRLVYAPPLSIGKFGGDIDNWMWPRHTGDFTYLRAYVAKDGSAAPYSKDNVPYRPKHWLAVNAKGVEAGDFVMVAGYPGRTNRYRLTDELQDAIEWRYPSEIAMSQEVLGMIDAAGKAKPDVAVAYASLVAGRNNYMKKLQGDMEGFARSDALATKRAQEAALDTWLAQQKQGGTLDAAALRADIGRLHRLIDARLAHRERDRIIEWLSRGGLFHATYQIVRLADERQKPDLEREQGFQKRDEPRVLGSEQRLAREMEPGVDKQLFVWLLQRYVKLPAGERLPALDAWLDGASTEAAIEKKAAALYAGTELTDTAARVKWLDATPEQIRASNDTWLRFMTALMPDLVAREREAKAFAGDEALLRPRYVAALTAYYASRGLPIYADANSSLRITFGTVKGYEPRDAVIHEPFTTAEGIVQKTTGVEPFDAPAAEVRAIRAKAYDGFASPKLGTLPVNFLSNLDITGGNSGSPTLDKDGRLVALAFDGVWEGVSSDWLFDPKATRTIHVDVRYMLWVMHHLDHADNLLHEMGVPVTK
ncbi:MAG TPA: S46 family peptidase, partial [Trinickia sp.]|nr:S46 family peptidase [Trinickia sp.]